MPPVAVEAADAEGGPRVECAVIAGVKDSHLVAVDAIVTRNIKDFRKSTVTVLDPVELLSAVDAIEAANP